MTDNPKQPARMGRPPVEEPKEPLNIRVKPSMRAVWQSCADAAGLPLNQWLERAANAQVKRDLRKGK